MANFSDEEIQIIRSLCQQLSASFPEEKFIEIVATVLHHAELSPSRFFETFLPKMNLYEELSESMVRLEMIISVEKILNIKIDDVNASLMIRFSDLIRIADKLYKEGINGQ